MERHPTEVPNWEGGINDLAKAVGCMRYDRIDDFLDALDQEITIQAESDLFGGRKKLSRMLFFQAGKLHHTANHMRKIWKLCKNHM